MQIFFDDLELPRLSRTQLGARRAVEERARRLYDAGAPANLVGRAHAVAVAGAPHCARAAALRGSWRTARGRVSPTRSPPATPRTRRALHDEIERLARPARGLPFLDDHDLRYRNRVLRPEPIARAVMFCLMDVSASMDEDKKDLAKRFFTLLYLFLTRKYTRGRARVRPPHRRRARRSTRRRSSTIRAVGRHRRVVRARARWRKSAASAMRQRLERLRRAGDRTATRSAPTRRRARGILRERCCRPRAITPISSSPNRRADPASSLWAEYERVADGCSANFAMRRASRREEIYPVFRELFRKEHDRVSRVLSRGSDWDFELIERYDAAIAAACGGIRARHLSRTRSRSSRRSRCSTPTQAAGCRSAIRTGPTARSSSATSSAYRRGMQGLAYEIVINSDPCIAYLMEENTMAMQALVDRARVATATTRFSRATICSCSGRRPTPIVDYLRIRAPLRDGMRGAARRRCGRRRCSTRATR